MVPDSPWLDARAAASYIGRKSKWAYQTILRFAREGKIRAGFDGKTWRFRTQDLDDFMYLNAKGAKR